MPISISRIVQALEPSATLAMAAKAKELKAAGKTVYDFSVGEPDFTTPEHICEAAVAAMQAGHTHYTVASGIPELKAAVAKQYRQAARPGLSARAGRRLQRRQALAAQRVHRAVRPGRRGDHPGAVLGQLRRPGEADRRRAGDRRDGGGEQLQADARPARGRPSRRARRCCCSARPSNPTGSMYSPEELEALADVVLERNLTVISDEIYEQLVYGPHASPASPRCGRGCRSGRSWSTA